jgi:peptidyl-prolyl cis-trans isomerase SurA
VATRHAGGARHKARLAFCAQCGGLVTGLALKMLGILRRVACYGIFKDGYTKTMRLSIFFLAIALYGADVTLMEEIICKVNGDIVTRGEMIREKKLMESELRSQGLSGVRLNDALNEGAKNILREKIDQLLLVQKAKELDIKVDTELNKQLLDIQRTTKIVDPEKFQEFVVEKTGEPYEDYKAELKNNLLREKVVREEISRKIMFKKDELEAYYNDHKDEFMRQERVFLREIFVSSEGKDAAGVAAAEKKAKDLVLRARKGERFAEMAQANSDAPNAAQGGEMPAFQKEDLKPELVTAIWNQSRGFVTDPIKVENPSGFAIFKVEEHQKAGLAEFEEVSYDVQDKLFRPKMVPALREYQTKMRQVAFLEIKPGWQDTGAAPGKDTTWSDPATLKPETVTKAEVAARGHRKKLLGLVPIPGTNTTTSGVSSSK